jgi:hypothetical protein
VLDRLVDPYVVTLDGNEQYHSVDEVLALWDAIEAAPALRRLAASVLFIEQPIARAQALLDDVHALSAARPLIIDESDADLDAFVEARARGYRGVLEQGVQGPLQVAAQSRALRAVERRGRRGALLHVGRGPHHAAGLALQQDLALVSVLGLTHVERNGHHYVRGLAALPPAEQRALLAAHPDLYVNDGGLARLRIARGRLDIRSLACAGFAAGAVPDWVSMRGSTPDAPLNPTGWAECQVRQPAERIGARIVARVLVPTRMNTAISGLACAVLQARGRMGRRTQRGPPMDVWYELAIREMGDLNEEVTRLLADAEETLPLPADDEDEEGE